MTHDVARLKTGKWLSVFGAAFAGLMPLSAQVPVSTSGWCSVRAPAFTLLSQLDTATTQAYGEQIDLLSRAMLGHIAFDPRVLPPATMVLFQNRGDFIALAPQKSRGVEFEDIQSDVSSYSRTSEWGAVDGAAKGGSEEDTRQAIMGGAVQWLVSASRHPLPLAINTGIVKVFSTFYVEDGKEYIGRPPRGITTHLAIAAERALSTTDRYAPVEHLLAEKSLTDIVARRGFQMFYAESWGFVHFLLFSKEMASTRALDRLIDAFGRGLSPHEALQQALGPAAKDIQQRLLNYLKGGDFFEIQAPVEKTALSAAAAPPEEAARILARLASGEKHAAYARAYAQQAVSLDPRAESYDTLALVESDDGQDKEALAASEKAAQLGSRDGWTWNLQARSRARLAQGATPSPANVRELMNLNEKAVSYRHDLKIGFDFIADEVATASRVTEDDGKFIVFGRKLFPSDGWLEVGQAQWARRSNEADLARRLLDDALAHPDNLSPAQAAVARQLRDSWSHPSG